MAKADNRLARKRRHTRVRKTITGMEEKPRLCVFRSLNNIYAQVIDDSQGFTLTSASNLEPGMKEKTAGKNKTACADLVGALIAQRSLDKGVKKVVFDRGGYKYHGRIKALADAARKAGLDF
jgi:large subunit ribosomal protein L18